MNTVSKTAQRGDAHELGLFQRDLQLDLLMAQAEQLRVEILDHLIHLTHDLVFAIIQPDAQHDRS